MVPRGSSKGFKFGNGGGGARTNPLGAPAVAKLTKPGDHLQVYVEPVVPIPKENKSIQILEATVGAEIKQK